MAASLACVTTAFAAHLASGGSAAPATVIIAFAGCGALVWLIAGVRVSPSQLLGLLVLCQAGVHVASMATSASDASMGVPMVLTHLLATAISLLALARGESFVWAVAQRLALRPLRLLLGGFALPAVGAVVAAIPATRPRRELLERVAPVRGPPTGFASVAFSR